VRLGVVTPAVSRHGASATSFQEMSKQTFLGGKTDVLQTSLPSSGLNTEKWTPFFSGLLLLVLVKRLEFDRI